MLILIIDIVRYLFSFSSIYHVHLTPQKCFLEAYSAKCPCQYPDISEPVQGRVKVSPDT